MRKKFLSVLVLSVFMITVFGLSFALATEPVVDCYPLKVKIDIKPGSFPNSINLTSKGNVPVAVFGSRDFDVTKIDRKTVFLECAPALNIGKTPEDINKDGFLDQVFHFSTQELAKCLDSKSTEACLTGKLITGQKFFGCDSVRIVRSDDKVCY